MKFIVNSSDLLKQLQKVAGVVPQSNTSMPILENFLFKIKDKVLTITGTDLETNISTSLPVEAEGDFDIAVQAKLALEILKTFQDQPLTFSVDTSNFAIELSSDFGKYKLAGFDPDEYPRTPLLEDSTKISVSAEVLYTAINKTIFATGNDDLRPVMSGIFVEISKENVRFVATDAHKLVRYTRTDSVGTSNDNFILPKKPLNILKTALASVDADVNLEFNGTYAKFSYDNTVILCRLIDGKYPNYNAVIPTENPNKLTIDRLQFLSAIKRVAVFANKTTYQTRLSITGSELTISAQDLDYNNEGLERVNCNYVGEDMEIGFNGRFLIDMLANLDTTEVMLELSAPNRAGILLPVNKENESEDVLMLVMPVMINN
ncbi:MAG: DNA polymerase III subunit beta [Luteibaculaceae bacterium]